MEIRNASRLECQPTLDHSRVTELLHPRRDPIAGYSVAQAVVPPGCGTLRHLHPRAEETYYVLDGDGVMEVAGHVERIGAGDAILIPPGSPHKVTAVWPAQLALLCVCCPAYTDEDTQIVEPVAV